MIFNKNHETLITTLKMKVTVIERVEDDDDLSFCFPKLKPFLLSFFSFWFVLFVILVKGFTRQKQETEEERSTTKQKRERRRRNKR